MRAYRGSLVGGTLAPRGREGLGESRADGSFFRTEGTEARGEVYVDKVTIGSLTIPRQTIEVARLLRHGVFGSGCDGVLGLGIGEVRSKSGIDVYKLTQ